MILGAISNSWQLQLSNHDLKKLVQDAQKCGARQIELRQTCMGDYETGDGEAWRPAIEKLAMMAKAFPRLSFNLAIEWSCLSRETDPRGEQFQSALQAAKVLNANAPQLRLVDRTTCDVAWTDERQVPAIALGQMADLTREASQQGVVVSIENVGQTIAGMILLVGMVRDRLPKNAGRFLGICPDPANQLPRFPDSDPVAEIESAPPDFLKIVHFKQIRGGKPHPTIDTGDVDCLRQMRVLKKIGYRSAIIMEIPPHERVMENLSASFAYLTKSTK
ncbi:MAG: TIM barrel protein [Desulfobacterales bacterium]|nr:TIM barrel protein [Desulfobacterales bacterium]